MLAAAAGVAFFVARDPGSATLTVRGYEITTSVAALGAAVLLLAALASTLFWALGLPRRLLEVDRRRRRDIGVSALEAALLAAAGGDMRTAHREARRAEQLLSGSAAPRLIAAQASEQLGDLAGAEAQYAWLLSDRRTEVVARRGLAASALGRRDYDTAILHAREAFATHPDARWAFDLLFDAQVRASRWEEALDTLQAGGRRHLTEDALRRRRSVLLAAAASWYEPTDPARARELAEQASSLSPAFAPAAALAARLLTMSGKTWRAAGLLEHAWVAGPHPAITLAYRDLKPGESEAARAKRMMGLAQMNPEHRESRILRAEQALAEGDGVAAEAALAPLLSADREPSARLCGLAARAAQARGDTQAARTWTAQATYAAGEPDWSDLDPEGSAFAYTREDWARLVFSYGDTGKLIHPRHERYERERLTAPTQILLEGPEETAPAPPAQPAAPARATLQPAAVVAAPAPAQPAPPPWEPPAVTAKPPPPGLEPWEPQGVKERAGGTNGSGASPPGRALAPKPKSSPEFYARGQQPDDPGVGGADE